MKRNILGLVGIDPVNDTLIGMAGNMDPGKARRWLARMNTLGRAAA
jgi:hypothetical protein